MPTVVIGSETCSLLGGTFTVLLPVDEASLWLFEANSSAWHWSE